MQRNSIFPSFIPWRHATSRNSFSLYENGGTFCRSKNDGDTDEEEDYYSHTSWERHPGESEEDYNDRIEDQEDFMDYYE